MRFRAGGDLSPTRAAGMLGCIVVGLLGTQVPALATAALLVGSWSQ